MATASLFTPDKPDVVLTLTHDEALTLFTITGRIGGKPVTSRRGHMNNIRAALQPVMKFTLEETSRASNQAIGSIEFDIENEEV